MSNQSKDGNSTVPSRYEGHPVEVELKEADRLLLVNWSDGHKSEFPLRYLRGFCPCAGCQGHKTGPPEFIPTSNDMIVDVQPVGSYGMAVIWDSGHNTGIYSFDYLRKLCPSNYENGIKGEWY